MKTLCNILPHTLLIGASVIMLTDLIGFSIIIYEEIDFSANT